MPSRSPLSARCPSLVVLFAVLAFAPRVWAHDHTCDHTHYDPFDEDLSICDDENAVCDESDAKECITRQSRTRGWCECQKPKGLTFLGHSALAAGPPSEFASLDYGTSDDPANLFDAVSTEDGSPLLQLGPGGEDVSGSLTLSYGSFSDPTNIPVMLVALSLSVPSMVVNATPTGVNSLHLPAGPAPVLIYDSTSARIEGPSTGIPIVIDNDLGSWTDSTLHLQLRLQPSGADALLQGVAFFPPAIPSGSPGSWLLLVVALMAAAALALGLRARGAERFPASPPH